MITRTSFSKLLLPLVILLFLAFAIFVERSGISYKISDSPAKFLEPIDVREFNEEPEKARTLILTNPEGLAKDKSYLTVAAVLESMKIPYKAIDASQFSLNELEKTETLITTFIEFNQIENDLSSIAEWVFHGGKLLIAIRPDNTASISPLLPAAGIRSVDSGYAISQGVEFINPLLPGAAGQIFGNSFINNSSLPVTLDREADIHVISGDEQGIPILWDADYGDGKIVFINTDQFIGKDSRGIINAAYSLLNPVTIYPVINSAVFFIDDFPAPIPEGTDKAIFRQFNRDIKGFFLNIWLPDMQEIQNKFKLKFSVVAIENYTDSVKPPFQFTAGQEDIFQFFGGFILRDGGEIGLHGYNHIPFCLEGDGINQVLEYPSWTSERHMQSSISELNRFILSFFPDVKPQVYVPVSNILCKDAREWLPAVIPDLRVIASVYLPDAEVPAYVQEFEEASDGIIEFPRITSGYMPDDYMKWAAVNELGLHYVFSHFIHPDDVLDSYRNQGSSWTHMRKVLNDFLLWIYSAAPGIRNLTASQGAMAVQRYARVIPNYECDAKECRLSLEGFYDSAWFLLRTQMRPQNVVNGSISRIADDIYLLEAKAENVIIGFGGQP